MKLGVLAIQGSFAEHKEMCEDLGYKCEVIKNKYDLQNITHIIFPGGESTTMLKLLKEFEMWSVLEEKIKHSEIKIFGTCAGAILCSYLGMNIAVERNAYGSQLHSFITEIPVNKNSTFYTKIAVEKISAAFIRAPKIQIKKNSETVEIISSHKTIPVLVEENNFLACSFHPEIIKDYSIYQYFLA